MSLDAAMLYYTARELRSRLVGAHVDKIYMPSRDEILFAMRMPGEQAKLFISARPGSARLHITDQQLENPAVPPSFCMLLRKHLSSGRVADIRTVDSERIVFIDFDALNEMGDRVKLTASIELMGRYSNFVLINSDGIVIDALKRITAEQSDKRQLLPGIEFTLPPAQNKLLFFTTGGDEVLKRISRISKPLSAALLESVAGLCPALCREIAFGVDPAADSDADTLSAAQYEAVVRELLRVREAAGGKGATVSIVYDGKTPVEFSFVELKQYQAMSKEKFDTASEMFDCYYSEKDAAERAKVRSLDLTRQVKTLLDKIERKRAARMRDIDDTGKALQKKLYGELINANLHILSRGMSVARVVDYYSGNEVEIPLDITKTPVQNAQKYYKEYRKLTTAAAMLQDLIKSDEHEIEYLNTVLFEISLATADEDYVLIRKELGDAGYLRGFKYKEQKQKRRRDEFLRYESSEGFEILAGRNNAANDKLTLKIADKYDIWFHAKNAPGSHVVLRKNGLEPGDASLNEAAAIAAFHSSIADAGKVAVNYTPARNVKKAPGQRAGMVIYDNYSTAFVQPDAQMIEALKKAD